VKVLSFWRTALTAESGYLCDVILGYLQFGSLFYGWVPQTYGMYLPVPCPVINGFDREDGSVWKKMVLFLIPVTFSISAVVQPFQVLSPLH